MSGGDNYQDHATQFNAKVKILKISNLFKHEVAKIVFQHYRQNLPPLWNLIQFFLQNAIKFLLNQHMHQIPTTISLYIFPFVELLNFNEALNTKE